jgi:hypothetical protein
MAASPSPQVRRAAPMMRNALVVSALILLGLGLDLTLFPGKTATFFSWPIAPNLSAGTFGAFYFTALAALIIAMRGWVWARIRPVLPGGIVFSALLFLATMIHLGKFNFDAPGTAAKIVAWVWTIAYAILPPVLLIAVLGPQRHEPGTDPPRERLVPWFRAAVVTLGAVMIAVGVALWVAPEQVAKVWPGALTALTGRVLGSWAIGLGLVYAVSGLDDRRQSVEPAAGALALMGVFQLLTLARFNGDVSWGEAGAWLYVAFLVASLAVGAYGLAQTAAAARTPARAPVPA